MTHYYLKVSAAGSVLNHLERQFPLEGFNENGDNGKPYIVPVPIESVTKPAPLPHQKLDDPVYVLSPPSITWAAANKPIPKVRDLRVQEVNALLQTKFEAGRIHNGATYQIRSQDRQNLIAIKAMLNGGTVSAHGGTYRDIDNNNVVLNDTQMVALCDDVFIYCRDLLLAAAAHKDAIITTTPVAAVVSYDINTGWPVNA